MSTQRISLTTGIYSPEFILYGLSLVLWVFLPIRAEFLCERFERAAWAECGLGVLDKIEDANTL